MCLAETTTPAPKNEDLNRLPSFALIFLCVCVLCCVCCCACACCVCVRACCACVRVHAVLCLCSCMRVCVGGVSACVCAWPAWLHAWACACLLQMKSQSNYLNDQARSRCTTNNLDHPCVFTDQEPMQLYQ
jgi:hypothetical protein